MELSLPRKFCAGAMILELFHAYPSSVRKSNLFLQSQENAQRLTSFIASPQLLQLSNAKTNKQT